MRLGLDHMTHCFCAPNSTAPLGIILHSKTLLLEITSFSKEENVARGTMDCCLLNLEPHCMLNWKLLIFSYDASHGRSLSIT